MVLKGQEIPAAGFLDLFTRTDELLIMNQQLLAILIETLTGIPAAQILQMPAASITQLTQQFTQQVTLPGAGRYLTTENVKIFDRHGMREVSTTYYPKELADCTENVYGLLMLLNSSFDQDVTVQVVGGISQIVDSTNSFNIGASQTLSAGTVIGLGVDLTTDWYPYMGCAVTTGATAPASGHLNAWVYLRKWLK